MIRRLVLCLLAWGFLAAQPALGTTILIVGDSISAGYGVETGKGWVTLLQNLLTEKKQPGTVINASVSGDTTTGALARLPELLERNQPDVVVIELGGNDGLQGHPVSIIEQNLEQMIATIRKQGSEILLLGMKLPPNYGPQYTDAFAALFQDIADREKVALLPFLLDGVAGHDELMQEDGIHPATIAQPLLLKNVWTILDPLLQKIQDGKKQKQIIQR